MEDSTNSPGNEGGPSPGDAGSQFTAINRHVAPQRQSVSDESPNANDKNSVNPNIVELYSSEEEPTSSQPSSQPRTNRSPSVEYLREQRSPIHHRTWRHPAPRRPNPQQQALATPFVLPRDTPMGAPRRAALGLRGGRDLVGFIRTYHYFHNLSDVNYFPVGLFHTTENNAPVTFDVYGVYRSVGNWPYFYHVREVNGRLVHHVVGREHVVFGAGTGGALMFAWAAGYNLIRQDFDADGHRHQREFRENGRAIDILLRWASEWAVYMGTTTTDEAQSHYITAWLDA